MVEQKFIPTIKDENPGVFVERYLDPFWKCRMCDKGRYSIVMLSKVSPEGFECYKCSTCGHETYTDIDWSKYNKPPVENLEIDAAKWRRLKSKLAKIEKHAHTIHDLILEVDEDTSV